MSINIMIKDYVNSIETQTESSQDFSETYRVKVDYLLNDFEEFKRFVTSEISTLKSIFTSPNDTIPFKQPTEESMGQGQGVVIKALNDRIASLEKQLDQKQSVIEGLLNIKSSSYIYEAQNINTASTLQNVENSHKQKSPLRINTTNTISEKTKERNKKQSHQPPIIKKSIVIIGDSMLNNIDPKGLGKKHQVKVRSYGGSTTKDMIDFIKPTIRKKPDVIVMHVGTNDITSDCATIMNLQEIVENVKSESPETKFVLSSVINRDDRNDIQRKVSQINKKLENFSNLNDIELVDNSNIGLNCLSKKKLHLNIKGDAQLAKNFINFINNV